MQNREVWTERSWILPDKSHLGCSWWTRCWCIHLFADTGASINTHHPEPQRFRELLALLGDLQGQLSGRSHNYRWEEQRKRARLLNISCVSQHASTFPRIAWIILKKRIILSLHIGPSASSSGRWSMMCRNMGRRKAIVLPLPVLAMPMRSLPDITAGIAWAWIGVGFS